MKHSDVNRAFPVLLYLKDTRMPIKSAYEIHAMIEALRPLYAFAAQREKELLQSHGAEVNTKTVSFQSAEAANQFQKEYDEFNNTEVDMGVGEVILKLVDIGEAFMSPADIERLRGFVRFE